MIQNFGVGTTILLASRAVERKGEAQLTTKKEYRQNIKILKESWETKM